MGEAEKEIVFNQIQKALDDYEILLQTYDQKIKLLKIEEPRDHKDEKS